MPRRFLRFLGGGEVLRPVGDPPRSPAPAPETRTRRSAPDALAEIEPWAAEALRGLAAGDAIVVITWFHRARREIMQVHPRSDLSNPLTGVFATRSPDRPNPLGLHPVTIRAIDGLRLRIGPIEALDGTPVVDIKPDLSPDHSG